VGPVLCGVGRQLLPSLDNQHAGIAYFTIASISQLETSGAVVLVLLTISKAGTTRFCFTDAATILGPVQLRLVGTHRQSYVPDHISQAL